MLETSTPDAITPDEEQALERRINKLQRQLDRLAAPQATAPPTRSKIEIPFVPFVAGMTVVVLIASALTMRSAGGGDAAPGDESVLSSRALELLSQIEERARANPSPEMQDKLKQYREYIKRRAGTAGADGADRADGSLAVPTTLAPVSQQSKLEDGTLSCETKAAAALKSIEQKESKEAQMWRASADKLLAAYPSSTPQYCVPFNKTPNRTIVGSFSQGGFCFKLPTFYQLTWAMASDKTHVGHAMEYPQGRDPEKRYVTDAGHHYELVYSAHLEHLRGRSFSMLEIGTYLGKSIFFFKAYMPHVRYVAVDQHHPLWYQWHDHGARARGLPEPTEAEMAAYNVKYGFEYVAGNQNNLTVLALALAKLGGCVDVVIDDGAHDITSIVTSFKYLFPRVSSGGMYFIEDLSFPTHEAVQLGSHDTPNSFVYRTKGMLDVLNRNLVGAQSYSRLNANMTHFSVKTKVDHLIDSFFCQEEACVYTKSAMHSCDPVPRVNRQADQPSSPDNAFSGPIKMLSATYGENCGTVRGAHTEKVAAECDGKWDCGYRVSKNRLATPNCPKKSPPGKSFYAEYTCGPHDRVHYMAVGPDADFQLANITCPRFRCVQPTAIGSLYQPFMRWVIKKLRTECTEANSCSGGCKTAFETIWDGCLDEQWSCLKNYIGMQQKVGGTVKACGGIEINSGVRDQCQMWPPSILEQVQYEP